MPRRHSNPENDQFTHIINSGDYSFLKVGSLEVAKLLMCLTLFAFRLHFLLARF